MTAIDAAPVMNLRPQDVDSLVEELQAYHAIYTARCFSAANNVNGRLSICGVCCWKFHANRLSP
jgi:hypothetical protein